MDIAHMNVSSNKDTREIISSLSPHVIEILSTPEDKQCRMHPLFATQGDTGCYETEYERNKKYHDHIEQFMHEHELRWKRQREYIKWREYEDFLIRKMIREMDISKDTLPSLKQKCYNERMWIQVRDEYLQQQNRFLSG